MLFVFIAVATELKLTLSGGRLDLHQLTLLALF